MSSSSSRVEVVIRSRPTLHPASELVSKESNTLNIHLGRHIGKGVEGGVNNQNTDWTFNFDQILTDASQQKVYDLAAKDIVENVIQGYNGTIMAYGQTGAGKTYTMSGDKLSYENRGIIPRAISHIFRAMNDRPDLAFRINVSYVEIYNEHLFDLLAVRLPSGVRNPSVPANVDLALQEDALSGAIHIKGLNKKEITTEQQCLDALFQGDNARAIGEHSLNQQSTRSHCIYTIYLETRSRVESSEKVLVSKLNLIDLAGQCFTYTRSERVGKTNSSGILLSEAKFINKSLSFLEQVVMALTSKNRDHIPFRQSRLTQLLKDSLGGNTKTRVICNIHADKPNLDETISTLKFGSRMRKITNRLSANVELDPLLHVAKLQKEIRELKHELQMHNVIANRIGVNYDPYTPEESAELRKRLEQYIEGGPKAEEIQIESLRQVREAFKQFKEMIFECKQKGETLTSTELNSTFPPSSISPDASFDESQMVGEVDELSGGGFGLGQVSADRRPPPRPDSRDEPLKPKNILRARARAAASEAINQQSGSMNQPTHVRGGSASRRAATAASPTSNTNGSSSTTFPPVNQASGQRNQLSNNNTMTKPRRSSFDPNNSSQEEKVNPVRSNNYGRVAPAPSPSSSSPPSESLAFDEFRSGSGFDLSELLSNSQADALALKRDFRHASIQVNQTKKRIDSLQSFIEEKRTERSDLVRQIPSDVEVLEEDEYEAIQELAKAKSEYKQLFAQRRELDESLQSAESAVQQSRIDLFNAFADWYKSQYGIEPNLINDAPSQSPIQSNYSNDSPQLNQSSHSVHPPLHSNSDESEPRTFHPSQSQSQSQIGSSRNHKPRARRPQVAVAFK